MMPRFDEANFIDDHDVLISAQQMTSLPNNQALQSFCFPWTVFDEVLDAICFSGCNQVRKRLYVFAVCRTAVALKVGDSPVPLSFEGVKCRKIPQPLEKMLWPARNDTFHSSFCAQTKDLSEYRQSTFRVDSCVVFFPPACCWVLC